MSDTQGKYVIGEFNTDHHTTSEPSVIAKRYCLASMHVTVVAVHKYLYFTYKNEKQL